MIKKGIIFCWISLALLVFSSSLYGAPGVIKEAESLITQNASTFWDDRYGDAYINCVSFNQDSLVSFGGWQYAAYYNSSRYVAVSRRQLPAGAWQECVLTDYRQTTDDNHNTISMGISPSDGRIHLAFDHHNSALHYRKSEAGLATNPGSVSWSATRFGAIESSLGGSAVTGFTYPCFARAPGGTFIMYGRVGESGNGDNHVWRYNNNGSWSATGRFVAGSGENAYHHGMCYDSNDRLHTTWCWRATSDGTTNHDLCYAYSDDHGATWRNNAGSLLCTTGSDPINPSKDYRVWTIPQSGGLINQEGMIADGQNRVHVVSRENVSGTNYQMHYYRDTSGTWHRINTNIRTKIWDNRSKIACDSQGNVFAVLPNLQMASASLSSGYTDWGIASSQDDGRFVHSEPLVDAAALSSMGELYVFVQAGTSSSVSGNLYAIRYTLGAQSQTPQPGKKGDVNGNDIVDIVDALLVAQYYVGLSPSGFISANADVNCNGNIDIVDALLIAQFYVGLVTQFC